MGITSLNSHLHRQVNLFQKFFIAILSIDDFRSPLMTWGEIEDTPLRLDQNKYKVFIYFTISVYFFN